MANYFDPSLLRDRITAWLGDQMGFEFTPRGVPVDVVLTGDSDKFGSQYLGSYYFSENVRVDENRLNIEKLKESDTDPLKITGGYLVQNGKQTTPASPDYFETRSGLKWSTHTPSFDTTTTPSTGDDAQGGEGEPEGEEAFADSDLGDGYDNPAQQQYIQDLIQQMEDVLFEGGTAYRDLMDVESAAKYWFVNAASLNADAYNTGSTYLYKYRDKSETEKGKLYWGPLWDFDFAWNNMPETTGFVIKFAWLQPLFYDREDGGFVQELHNQWPTLKQALNELTVNGGLIDQYCAETKASAVASHAVYSDEPYSEADYERDVQDLKDWIDARVAWMDAHFDELDSIVHRVQFMNDGELLLSVFKNDGDVLPEADDHPEKEGQVFVG